MMHLLLFSVVALLGVETVMADHEIVRERKFRVFPGKQLSVNSSSSLTTSQPAVSIIRCSSLCLEDADCVAANYEDVGVCHMSSCVNITMKDSNHTTAITIGGLQSAKDFPSLVGLWPLQEPYGGRDLRCHANIELHDVTFPDDDVTPWARPAASFNENLQSYGHIQHGQNLDVQSFSWMAKVYPVTTTVVNTLMYWHPTDENLDVEISLDLAVGYLGVYIKQPTCSFHFPKHNKAISLNAWHTVAVSYDFPTNTITLWLDGQSHVSTVPPCGTAIATSNELYVGTWRREGYFDGRLSCMSLFRSVVDYDVMYNTTMSHCGGGGKN